MTLRLIMHQCLKDLLFLSSCNSAWKSCCLLLYKHVCKLPVRGGLNQWDVGLKADSLLRSGCRGRWCSWSSITTASRRSWTNTHSRDWKSKTSSSIFITSWWKWSDTSPLSEGRPPAPASSGTIFVIITVIVSTALLLPQLQSFSVET